MKKVFAFISAVALFAVAATAQNATFEGFLQQFPKASLPYTLGEQDLRSHLEARAAKTPVAKTNRLAWEYYSFLPSLEAEAAQNRMPVHPEPVALLETSEYYAVVFNTGRSFTRQYKTYQIAVFTKDGILMSTRTIAGVNPTSLAAATVDANLDVTVKEYSVNWANDYATFGIEGNTLTGIQATNTYTFSALNALTENSTWNNTARNEKTAVAAK